MTQVIDERVVEMKFDNKDFEKNVAESMSTLEKLKNALNFDSVKSLQNLGNATKGFDMSNVANQVQEAANKFSALEIAGITAIAKITNAAMDMGVKLVKSLSIDQVTSGFNKYAEKTTAVQTIMAATAKQFSSQSEQMAVIEEQLSKLAWYTDETSYNFVDMVGNIGKFTSNNIGLEESVTAMQGIANWAAISGQNAQTASRAMYNIAQAMGVGAMKVQDWKSIENANMATAQFKETAMETAAQLGKLRKVADGLYETLDGKGTVTVETFREELKRGWFDKEVMMQTFAVYGDFTNKVYEFAEATDLTATRILQAAEDFKNGNLDIAAFAEETQMPVEELTAALEELNSEQYAVGNQALRNAQEAKTFGEVIDSVKDAVSTKWSETFEIIFGNYLEAKKLWTGLANDLWSVFAGGGDERNEMLSFWKDLEGRDNLIKGIINTVNLLVKPLQVIHRALKDMFPDAEGMGTILADLTRRFEEFTAKIQPSEEVLRDIYIIFQSIFTVGKLVAKIFLDIVHTIFPVTAPIRSLAEMIIHVVATVSAYITVISEFIIENGLIPGIVNIVITAFQNLISVLKTVTSVLGTGVLAVIGGVIFALSTIGSKIYQFMKQAHPLQRLLNFFTKTLSKINDLLSKIRKSSDKTTSVAKKMTRYFGAASDSVAEYGTITKDSEEKTTKFGTALEKIGKIVKTVATVIVGAVVLVGTGIKTLATTILNFFKNIKTHIANAKTGAANIIDVIKGVIAGIGETLENAKTKFIEFLEAMGVNTDEVKEGFAALKDSISTFISSITPGKIIAIAFAAALLGIAGAAVKLSSTLTDTLGAAKGLMYNINKIINKQFAKATVFTDVAKGIALIAASLALLTYVDDVKLEKVSGIMLKMVITAGAFAVVLTLLSGMFAKKNLVEGFQANITMMIAMAGAMLVLSLALAALTKVTLSGSWKDWVNKLGIMLVLLAEVSAAAIIVSKFAPVMAKGSILILALALAMKYIAEALVEISSITIPEFSNNIGQFGAILAGIGVIIYAIGNLKLTSALNILMVAKAIQLIFPEIVKVLHMFTAAKFDEMAGNIEKHIQGAYAMEGAMVALAAVIYAIGNLGKLFMGIGVAVLGIGIGINLIIKAIKGIEELMQVMTPEQFTQALKIITGFIAIFFGFIVFVRVIDTTAQIIAKMNKVDLLPVKFASLAIAMVALAGSMLIMVGALDMLSSIKVPAKELAKLAAILGGLTLVFGIAVALAGLGARNKGAVAVIVSMLITLTVMIAELAVLSWMINEDPNGVFRALVTMIAIMTMLSMVFLAVGRIGYKKTGPLLAITAMITVLTGLMVVVGALADKIDLRQGLIAVGASAGILLAMIALFRVIALIPAKPTKVAETLNLMLWIVGSLVALMTMIGVLSYVANMTSLTPGIAALSVSGIVITAMAALLRVIALIPAKPTRIAETLNLLQWSVGLLIGLMTAVAVLALVSNVADIMKAVAVMGMLAGIATGMTALISVISLIPTTKAKIVNTLRILYSVVGSLAVLALAIGALARLTDMDKLRKAAIIMAQLTTVISVITAGLTVISSAFKTSWKNVLPMLALMGGIVLEIIATGYVIGKLATLDTDKLTEAGDVMTKLVSVMGVIAAAMAAIGGIFGTSGAGAIGMALAAGVIIAVGAAILLCGISLKAAADGFDVFADAFGRFAEVVSWMQNEGNVDLPALADGLGKLVGPLVGVVLLGTGAGIALGILANGLTALNDALSDASDMVTNLEALSKIDFGALAGGFVELGLGAIVLGAGVDSINNFSKAIDDLKKNLDIKDQLDGFWTDIANAFKGEGKAQAVKAAYDAALEIAGSKDKHMYTGFIGGLHDGLGWGCPVTAISGSLMTGISNALLDNGVAVASAKTSGGQIAEGLKEGWNKVVEFFTSDSFGGPTLFTDLGASVADTIMGTTGDPAVASSATGFGDWIGQISGSQGATSFQNWFTSGVQSVLNGINISFDGVFSGSVHISTAYERLKEVNPVLNEGAHNTDKLRKATDDLTDSFKAGSPEIKKTSKETKDLTGFINDERKAIGLSALETKKGIKSVGDVLDWASEKVKSVGADYNNYISKIGETVEETAKTVTEGFGDMGDAATSSASKTGKAVKDLIDGVKSSIENLDFFSKFEMKTEMTAETLLENMRSNLDGVASWTHKLTLLVTRGIDQGILEKLYEMGPQGYETVNAFTQMTAEQLEEANQIWQTKLALPDKVGDILGSSLAQCGHSAVEGWTGALKEHIGEHEAIYGYFDDQINFVKEDMLEINSPSHVFERFGIGCIEGLIKGLTDEFMMARLLVNIRAVVCFKLIEEFRTDLNPDIFAEIGRRVLEGLLAGLSDEGLIGSIVSAVETICSLIEPAASKILEINSPSKVMRRVGNSVGEGLTLGILDGAYNVEKAAEQVAEGAANGLIDTTNRVQDLINSELDFNPIITPMLDLSYMRAQLEEANAMFGARQAYLYGSQNGGYPYGYGAPQINYTQNNYSPKALSRVEIYRQTQNQLNTMKGVVKANA